MMNTYNNNQMTTNAEGKIFNPVTKRHIKNNVINRNSIKSQIERHNLKVSPPDPVSDDEKFKLIVFFMDGFKYEGLFNKKSIFCCDVVNRIREARTEDDTTDYKFYLEGDEDQLIKFDIDESNNYFGMPFRCSPVQKFKLGCFRVTSKDFTARNVRNTEFKIIHITKAFIYVEMKDHLGNYKKKQSFKIRTTKENYNEGAQITNYYFASKGIFSGSSNWNIAADMIEEI